MSLQIIVKNSSVSGNAPTVGQLANGELALNYHADGPFITCKDTNGVVRRVTSVWVNAAAPSSPMPGEFWLDISVNPPQLKVYKDSGDAWVVAIAALPLTGGTLTGSLSTTGTNTAASFIPTSSSIPSNGIYLPAANQVAISSNSTERMRIKSTGTINFSSVSTYADNAAAIAGSLAVGDVYKTAVGDLMIRY